MCEVREGSGHPWGTVTFRDCAEETPGPGPSYQHRVHSWEVLAPAHLLTRELLPHETRQSQDLWDKNYCILILGCPSLAGPSSFQGPG